MRWWWKVANYSQARAQSKSWSIPRTQEIQWSSLFSWKVSRLWAFSRANWSHPKQLSKKLRVSCKDGLQSRTKVPTDLTILRDDPSPIASPWSTQPRKSRRWRKNIVRRKEYMIHKWCRGLQCTAKSRNAGTCLGPSTGSLGEASKRYFQTRPMKIHCHSPDRVRKNLLFDCLASAKVVAELNRDRNGENDRCHYKKEPADSLK